MSFEEIFSRHALFIAASLLPWQTVEGAAAGVAVLLWNQDRDSVLSSLFLLQRSEMEIWNSSPSLRSDWTIQSPTLLCFYIQCAPPPVEGFDPLCLSLSLSTSQKREERKTAITQHGSNGNAPQYRRSVWRQTATEYKTICRISRMKHTLCALLRGSFCRVFCVKDVVLST